MKTQQVLLFLVLAAVTAQATAHLGPEAMERHFIEHLLIVLSIGLPIAYGLFRLLKWSRNSSR